MFTFIHTSDWHLGQNFYGYDRCEEQSDFLSQLAEIARVRTPDALLVSGDIFHTASPSNAAVKMYANALLDIHEACPSMAIIVIAGNHDSASRLECEERLWKVAGVNVLGGIARDKDGKADLDRHIINVGNKAIVAAIPFAYSGSFPAPPDFAVATGEDRQQNYFQAILDRANELNGSNVPVVLMAHLAVRGSDTTGHDRDMAMESVHVDALGKGYDYAALGHIHRPQQLNERVRYCGTPLPVSFDEQCGHSVSIVTINAHGDLPIVETAAIKNLKPLHTIPAREPADFETVMRLAQELNPDERSYIRLNVLVERYLPHGAQEQAALALSGKQCQLCEIKKTSTSKPERRTTAQMTVDEFVKKSPGDIANRYFADKTGTPMTERQQEMFNEIYQLVQEQSRQ